MTPEKKEFVEKMNQELLDSLDELKLKYDTDIEYMGSFFFSTKEGMQAGTVLGKYNTPERLKRIASSLMFHPELREQLIKLSLQYLYYAVDEESNIPSTDELKDMLKDFNEN